MGSQLTQIFLAETLEFAGPGAVPVVTKTGD
jgi:hypothetical protein